MMIQTCFEIISLLLQIKLDKFTNSESVDSDFEVKLMLRKPEKKQKHILLSNNISEFNYQTIIDEEMLTNYNIIAFNLVKFLREKLQ